MQNAWNVSTQYQNIISIIISDRKQTLIKISHTVDSNIIPRERNLNLKIEKKEGGKKKRKAITTTLNLQASY